MGIHPSSKETVDVTIELHADCVKDIDSMRKVFLKKSRSHFIEDILKDWYRHEGNSVITKGPVS